LEHSVHEYQAERNRLEAAYRRMAASLGTPAIGLSENTDAKPTAGARRADGNEAIRAKARTPRMPASATQE
jgi:hypothetical protein